MDLNIGSQEKEETFLLTITFGTVHNFLFLFCCLKLQVFSVLNVGMRSGKMTKVLRVIIILMRAAHWSLDHRVFNYIVYKHRPIQSHFSEQRII